jgi:hypothetical protein
VDIGVEPVADQVGVVGGGANFVAGFADGGVPRGVPSAEDAITTQMAGSKTGMVCSRSTAPGESRPMRYPTRYTERIETADAATIFTHWE